MRLLVPLLLCAGGALAARGFRPAQPAQPRCPPGGLPADTAPAGLTPPRLDTVFIPPVPAPRSVRGAEIAVRVVVDSAGRVVPDSVFICGIRDRGYAERLAAVVARFTFHPAAAGGRPVPGVFRMSYRF